MCVYGGLLMALVAFELGRTMLGIARHDNAELDSGIADEGIQQDIALAYLLTPNSLSDGSDLTDIFQNSPQFAELLDSLLNGNGNGNGSGSGNGNNNLGLA